MGKECGNKTKQSRVTGIGVFSREYGESRIQFVNWIGRIEIERKLGGREEVGSPGIRGKNICEREHSFWQCPRLGIRHSKEVGEVMRENLRQGLGSPCKAFGFAPR